MITCIFFWLCQTKQPFSVDKFFLEYQSVNQNSRIAEIGNYKPAHVMSLNADLNLLGPLFWENSIHGLATEEQFRLVGWKFFLGVHVAPFLDVGVFHHSQHILDANNPIGRFPLEDAPGFRINFMRMF